MTTVRYKSAGNPRFLRDIRCEMSCHEVMRKLDDPKVKWLMFRDGDTWRALPKTRIVEITEAVEHE